ncbi:MAG TPA: MFS transporter [Anaerolineales bacterium]|nr:MFS transporter [Anaerolineales bacterium]
MEEKPESSPNRWRKTLIQRRINADVDARRPQRWNWYAIVRPLDRRIATHADELQTPEKIRSLRYFWIDGLFAAISENFYLGFVTLFALAYGATNGQVGLVTATGNLLGAISLFPGAQLVERYGQRKSVVVWAGGGVSRIVLLAMALFPFLINQPVWGVGLIIVFNGLRAFTANLSNPAWTSMVADLVPNTMRGRYFSSRNVAMGVAALVVAPLAGRLISAGNEWANSSVFGYQTVFFLAFAFGMVSTLAFHRIAEPPMTEEEARPHQRGDLRRALRHHPEFVWFVISAFVWNIALQVAAPFFNVYMVESLGASTTMVGLVSSVTSLFSLISQRYWGKLMDKKDAFWVQMVTGFLIPILPFAWMFITQAWHVGIINIFSGILWAGYNLANFNLLLVMTPDDQRSRAVALFQTVVFTSAVLGPIIGGYLSDAVNFQLVLFISFAGRLIGAGLFSVFVYRLYRKQQAKA